MNIRVMNSRSYMNALALAAAATFGIAGMAVAGNHGPEFWGKPVSESHFIDRSVVVDQDARWIHVKGGETIRFVVRDSGQDEVFVWRFNTYHRTPSIDLADIAPGNSVGEGRTTVLVRPDPLYIQTR